ncbi:MAG: hypothetical protein U0797_03135 [Gemmataceae bacterium]
MRPSNSLDGGVARGKRCRLQALRQPEQLGQAELEEDGLAVGQGEVARRQGEVLELVLVVQLVERLGYAAEVGEQLGRGTPGFPAGAALAEPVGQRRLARLADQGHPLGGELEPLKLGQRRVVELHQPVQRPRGRAALVGRHQEADQAEVLARAQRPPHLAPGAAADAFQQLDPIELARQQRRRPDGVYQARLAAQDGGPFHRRHDCRAAFLPPEAKLVGGGRGGPRRLVGRDQRLQELGARREPLPRVLVHRPPDDLPVGLGQLGQVGFRGGDEVGQLGDVLSLVRRLAGDQLGVGDRQAVLVAEQGGPSLEDLRGGVQRRDAGEQVGPAVDVGEAGDQAEVRHLDVPPDQEQVARLDVEVLQPVLLVQDVEYFRRLAQVGQHLVSGDADVTGLAVLREQVVQAAVGQLGDQDQVAVDQLDPLDRQQERVAKAFDVLQRAELLLGVAGGCVEPGVAGDELDRLEEPPRGLALPDLTEPALAQRLEELVAGDRFIADRARGLHGVA